MIRYRSSSATSSSHLASGTLSIVPIDSFSSLKESGQVWLEAWNVGVHDDKKK